MTKKQHDYVIVGGGTAGIMLGYLLKKYDFDVVVLEAGEDKDEDPNIKNIYPLSYLEDNFHNEYFWLENGKPNPLLPMDQNHYSGGRLWGGSSSINESIYWRGAQYIYDQWGGLFADHDFCTETFRKLETYHGSTQNPHLRGKHGPFHVTQTPAYPIGEKYAQALHDVLKQDYGINVPIVEDIHTLNGPAIGTTAQFFLDPISLTRMSTSRALLKNRKSLLKIISNATATKILFERKTAVGVQYIHQGQTEKIYASKKVIVCAGPRSPILLMHSGIGDREHLLSLGIELVHENPYVGQNLTNHLVLRLPLRVPVEDNREISQKIHFKRSCGHSAIPNPLEKDESDIALGIAVLSNKPGEANISSILLKPASRGYVSITSKDPLHPITVDTNYLSEPEDLDALEAALNLQEKIINHLQNLYPGYALMADIKDKTNYVKENTRHIHHWSGTCQIGKVLDEHLNVKGTQNLMVADTSIFPVITRGQNYAAALLIGTAAFTEITKIRDWGF